MYVCNHGGKQPKTRMTLLVAANMSGSEKLPLYKIRKYAKPRAFKNIKNLPVQYSSNKKAWMTEDFFTEWIYQRMKKEQQKLALIVNNCNLYVA